MLRGLAFVASVLALMLTAATPGWAVVVEGVVTNPNGGIIPGATVIFTSLSETLTFNTGDSGRYIAAFLRAGNYAVKVKAPGFFGPPLFLKLAEGDLLKSFDIVLAPGSSADFKGTMTAVDGTMIALSDKA